MSQEIILSSASSLDSAPLFTPTPKAAKRILEFFTVQINNLYTRDLPQVRSTTGSRWCLR